MPHFIEFTPVNGGKFVVNVDSIITLNTSAEGVNVFIHGMSKPLLVTVTIEQIKDALKGAGTTIIDFESSPYKNHTI